MENNTIGYLIKNDLKIAELKMLKFLYTHRRSKRTHIENGSKTNFYQVQLALKRLVELGIVKEKDNLYSINKKSPIVIKLFEDLV